MTRKKTDLKRFQMEMPHDQYRNVKSGADALGLKVNTYIRLVLNVMQDKYDYKGEINEQN